MSRLVMQLTRHLLELGHERIAMLAGNTALSPHHDRLEGFRKAMQESHLPIRDEYLACGELQIQNGIEATQRLLKLTSPPTAIMVSNNKLLLGVLTIPGRKPNTRTATSKHSRLRRFHLEPLLQPQHNLDCPIYL